MEKTIQDRKILYAWYFVYMSDRMSVTLNWDRLCVVCEKEGEVLSREEVLTYLQQEADEAFMRIFYFNLLFLFCFFTYFDKMTLTPKILCSKIHIVTHSWSI